MENTELVSRSPLRILEKSIHGGLRPGSIGVIASRKGVGKTACLVHIATDKLLQGKHVIHVSYSSRTDHIIQWYEDIFAEIARQTRKGEQSRNIHDEIIKNRVVMNFSQSGVQMTQVLNSLKAMINDGGFAADLVIVDGYDFGEGKPEDLLLVKQFATELGLSVWFSASVRREQPEVDEHGVSVILSPFVDQIDVLIALAPTDAHVKLNLLKDYGTYQEEDLHLILDPKSLLIANPS
ncbi:MAG: hypothetical protein EA426_11655 [Spirochaetaceae bacterium]|nr:MAG: hypothetical protein EA426_11655 [Spirochaetaceae bacterium]